MVRKKLKINIDEVIKNLDEISEETKKIENEIRSSTEYVCWLRNLLEENRYVSDYDIQYRKDRLEKKTYENICKLNHFYSIIRDYWEKYKIPRIYIEYDFRAPVYRVFYEDFYFEICRMPILEGYINVLKREKNQEAINYKDIMEDKNPKEYKEKLTKEFHDQIGKRIRY